MTIVSEALIVHGTVLTSSHNIDLFKIFFSIFLSLTRFPFYLSVAVPPRT